MARTTMKLEVPQGALTHLQSFKKELFWKRIAPALREAGIDAIRDNFWHGGRPDAWPLSKRVEEHGGKTLIDHQDLVSSIQGEITGLFEIEFYSPMEYASAHDEGYEGTVRVEAHERLINQAFGKAIDPTRIFVRSHSKEMNLPERRFMILVDEYFDEQEGHIADALWAFGLRE